HGNVAQTRLNVGPHKTKRAVRQNGMRKLSLAGELRTTAWRPIESLIDFFRAKKHLLLHKLRKSSAPERTLVTFCQLLRPFAFHVAANFWQDCFTGPSVSEGRADRSRYLRII